MLEMSKIPTAEELADLMYYSDTLGYDDLVNPLKFASLVAIELSKLHVKAALEAAQKDAQVTESVAFDSILNAYPLENIK